MLDVLLSGMHREDLPARSVDQLERIGAGVAGLEQRLLGDRIPVPVLALAECIGQSRLRSSAHRGVITVERGLHHLLELRWLVGFVDDSPIDSFLGLPVCPPDELKTLALDGRTFDWLVVTTLVDQDAVRGRLQAVGFPLERVNWL